MFRFPEGENETTQPVAEETTNDIAAETEVEKTEDAPEGDAQNDEKED